MTFNTGNPIGSTDARDLSDNAENFDYLENSTTELTHVDRLGTVRKTRHGMEVEHDAQIAAHETEHDAQMQAFESDFDGRLAGMAFTRVGSFTTGATLTDMRQVLVWEVSQGGDGNEYGWAGTFPKVVAPGTDPTAVAGYVPRTDVVLRQEVAMRRFTSAQAPAQSYYEGELIYLTDVGYVFKFISSRFLISGLAESEITSSDTLHILVSGGGMLQFDDFHKLKAVETKNFARYQAKLRSNSVIAYVSYGDSITYGLNESGGQYPSPYPSVMASHMTYTSRSYWSLTNPAIPGDRAITQYMRTRAATPAGDICTIMLGVNDVQYATNNGAYSTGILNSFDWNVENYTKVMRLFVARELLRGRCVVLLGTTQFMTLGGGDISVMSSTYLARAYDSAAKQVASEFGCAFVDTKRDITQQFGISESLHDGVHPNASFHEIIGKRLAAFFLQIDYKNPLVMRSGGVIIPNVAHNPVLSNQELDVINLFTDGSSPPLLGGVAEPKAVGIRLPYVAAGGIVTIPFYLDEDSVVAFPSINSNGTDYSFDLLLDFGATQPDYPSDLDVLLKDRAYIYSLRHISGNADKNRTTERYSQVYSGCYMHITTRGWHSITFVMGENAGIINLEGIVFDSWQNVKNHDVFGGVSGVAVWSDGVSSTSGFVSSVTKLDIGKYRAEFGVLGGLVLNRYRIDVEVNADYAVNTYRIYSKNNDGFSVEFVQGAGFGADVPLALYDPSSFKLTVLGGR